MPEQLQIEILIVGAGPAGIAAACIAAEAGKQTILLDNNPAPGGNIWRGSNLKKKPSAAQKWLNRLAKAKPKILYDSTAFAAPQPNTLLVETPDKLLEIHWQKLILATGARELFIPFPGWTLPNCFGCGGLQALVKGGWPIAGKRIIVAGSGPLLLTAAAQFRHYGATVPLIAEQTPLSSLMRFGTILPSTAPGKILEAINYKWQLLGVPFKTRTWVTAAQGKDKLESVTLTNGKKTWTEPCDLLACSYGLIPSLELPLILGCRIKNGVVDVDDRQQTSIPDVYCAGEPNGIGGADRALVEGQIAAHAATGQSIDSLQSARARAHYFTQALARAFTLRPELKTLAQPDTLICRCEDVTRARLEQHADWRSAKLHTRCGMGPCQGRICGGAVQTLFNWNNDSIRPPTLPVQVQSLISSTPIDARNTSVK